MREGPSCICMFFLLRMTHASCVRKGGHGCRGERCTHARTSGPMFEMDGIRCACSMRECHRLSLASASAVCRCTVLCPKVLYAYAWVSSYIVPVLPASSRVPTNAAESHVLARRGGVVLYSCCVGPLWCWCMLCAWLPHAKAFGAGAHSSCHPCACRRR